MNCSSGGSQVGLPKQRQNARFGPFLEARIPKQAQSTCRSQNVKTIQGSDHFVKKLTRHAAGKHMSESKCTKHYSFGPLLEVRMFWRQAHVEVTM